VLPEIASLKLASFCDIFCEKMVFSVEESRKILTKAKGLGLGIKIHADEIQPMGGAILAAELGCISAEHLLKTRDTDFEIMAKAGTIAVLLPATSFYLDKNYARARDMISAGVPVALATDFNPGSSPNYNMQLVLNLACLKLRMTPAEAIAAATLNAAAAIGVADKKGSIELGKDADFVIWDAPDLDFLFYRYGNNQAFKVVKGGQTA
jgi:imidazolonepropionase